MPPSPHFQEGICQPPDTHVFTDMRDPRGPRGKGPSRGPHPAPRFPVPVPLCITKEQHLKNKGGQNV